MTNRVLLLLVITIFVATIGACSLFVASEKEDELLPGIIHVEKFAAIVADMHLVEALMVRNQTKVRDVFMLSQQYYDSLFVKHGVTRQQVEESLAFYSRYPHLFDPIYQDVIILLSKQEQHNAQATIIDSVQHHVP